MYQYKDKRDSILEKVNTFIGHYEFSKNNVNLFYLNTLFVSYLCG